jgi:16S rRNA G966 N2-methylase RsmD
MELSKYDDSTAVRYYDEALELDSSYPPALIGKAEACRMTRRYDEYFPALNRYIEVSGAGSKDKNDYLSALVEKSDPNFIKRFQPQLDTTMLKLAQAHPQDSLVYNLRGLYYFYTGRSDDAVGQFRQCVDEYPESYDAAATLIEFLMYDQRWEDLAAEGRLAFERFPQETAFLEMASVGDYNLERYEQVLEICDKVLEVAPSDSSKTLRAWSTKGDVYHILGDNTKDYKAYLKGTKDKFDIIFLDPPYDTNMLSEAMRIILDQKMLNYQGTIVLESGSDEIPEYGDLTMRRHYKSGRAYVTVLTNEVEE